MRANPLGLQHGCTKRAAKRILVLSSHLQNPAVCRAFPKWAMLEGGKGVLLSLSWPTLTGSVHTEWTRAMLLFTQLPTRCQHGASLPNVRLIMLNIC
jgi:hypothetical protein